MLFPYPYLWLIHLFSLIMMSGFLKSLEEEMSNPTLLSKS